MSTGSDSDSDDEFARMKKIQQSLPIYYRKTNIKEAIDKSQVLICTGETGSGKTTQVPQYLLEWGFGDAKDKTICVTQPRRVAAISVAKRVAEEQRVRLGEEVGYTIRFDDCSCAHTKIRYMTDGCLLRECLEDPNVERYAVIVLDEAHERSKDTDVLFGLLKGTLKRRKDLKLIIMSATLDVDKFSSFFSNCDVEAVPGRSYPVKVHHSKQTQIMTKSGPQNNYVSPAVDLVCDLHLREGPGDILLFLTGQDEIDKACLLIQKFTKSEDYPRDAPKLLVLPLYGALSSEMQSRIFSQTPAGTRKVVVATNIAETSLTIDGIWLVSFQSLHWVSI